MHSVPNFAYWPTLQQHSVALVLTTWFAMTHAKKPCTASAKSDLRHAAECDLFVINRAQEDLDATPKAVRRYPRAKGDCRSNGVSGLTAPGVSGAGRSENDRDSHGCDVIGER